MTIDIQLAQWCEQASATLNNLPSSVLIANTHGRIEFVNEYLAHLLGYRVEDLIGQKMWVVLDETQVQQTAAALSKKDCTEVNPRFEVFEALAARNDNHNIIWNLKKKSGGLFPFMTSVGQIKGASNKVIGLIAVANEATELEQQLATQEKLKQEYRAALGELTASQKRYQKIFSYAPLGIFHFDTRSVILDANSHMIDILSSEKSFIIGMNMLESIKNRDVVEAVRLCLEEGEGSYEGEYFSLKGNSIPLRGLFKAVRNTAGDITGGVGIFEDITSQYNIKEALLSSETSYREIFDNAPHTIYIQKRDGTFLRVNKSAERMYGYKAEEIEGRTPEFLAAPGKNDLEKIAVAIEKAWQGKPQKFEFWGLRKNGETFPKTVALHQGKYFDEDVLIVFAEDITDRKLAEAQINHLANQDSLTGLPNRRLLIERTEQLMKLAHRHKMKVSMLYLDLDKFKDINDTQGHDAGDQLLMDVSYRLKQCLRDSDTLARLGGDEFAILLPDSSNEHALKIANRILKAIEKPYQLAHAEVKISASMGIALFPGDGDSFQQLFRHADIAMYKAKFSNQNMMFFHPEHREEIEARVNLEIELANAIQNDELVLHYQPRIRFSDSKPVSVEALVRWQHPERCLIYPGVFIPIAETSELIVKVGQWVLNQAIQQTKKWFDLGINLPVAVNISIQELQSSNLADEVERLLDKHHLPAALLELEITETAAMTNVEQSLRTMTQLKELGIKLSIDDFGTGYSSLNYLKKLPADFLKIDRSFIVDLSNNTLESGVQDKKIITTIVALGKSLGMPLIAEGVETIEQENFLKSVNVEMAQGFLYCKPLPNQQFLEWLNMQQKNKNKVLSDTFKD